MIKANVILDYSKWKNKIKDPDSYLKKKLRKLSKIPYFQKKKQEFSILLTNNKKMKNLNFKFKKKNKTTDVLSFPLKNGKDKTSVGLFFFLNLKFKLFIFLLFVKRTENSYFFFLKKLILFNLLNFFLK